MYLHTNAFTCETLVKYTENLSLGAVGWTYNPDKELKTIMLSLYSGIFYYRVIVDSQHLHVEREKQVQTTIMATFATGDKPN